MKISIIICVYNSEEFLRRCFDSVRKQSYTDFEVVVVNDGSPDNSQEIIDEYVKIDKRFKSVRQKNCENGIDSFRRGVAESSGEYIVSIDADDEIKEDYILSLSKVVDENLDFGFSRYTRVFDRKSNFIEKRFKYINSQNITNTNIKENPELLIKIPNALHSKIFRKKFLLDNDILYITRTGFTDMTRTRKLLLCNPTMAYIDNDGYIYHIRSGSIMTSSGERIFNIFYSFDEIVRFAYEKKVFDLYHDELEYLAFYHIGIGTMYRSFCYKPLSFFTSLKRCRKYLKKYNFKNNNKYINNLGLFEKIYLLIFFTI